MPKRLLILCFLMCTSVLFAQLDSNSVTVTTSRSVNLQPDQVLLAVYVTSGLNTSLDDVLEAVKPLGITIANFSGVGSNSTFGFAVGIPSSLQPVPSLQWTFGLPVAFSKMKDTIAAVTALQHEIPQTNLGLILTFSVQGTQVSDALQQSQACSIPDLIADARAQAQKLASAGGLVAGPILAMSTVSPSVAGVSVAGALSAAFLTVPQSCVLTVKFALTRF